MWPIINTKAGEWFPAKYVQGGSNNLRGLYAYKVFVGMLSRFLCYHSSGVSVLSTRGKTPKRERLISDTRDVVTGFQCPSLHIRKAMLPPSALNSSNSFARSTSSGCFESCSWFLNSCEQRAEWKKGRQQCCWALVPLSFYEYKSYAGIQKQGSVRGGCKYCKEPQCLLCCAMQSLLKFSKCRTWIYPRGWQLQHLQALLHHNQGLDEEEKHAGGWCRCCCYLWWVLIFFRFLSKQRHWP